MDRNVAFHFCGAKVEFDYLAVVSIDESDAKVVWDLSRLYTHR